MLYVMCHSYFPPVSMDLLCMCAEVLGSSQCVCVSQVLLRYHVQRGISVIPKSDRAHHIIENTKVTTVSSFLPSSCASFCRCVLRVSSPVHIHYFIIFQFHPLW